MNALPSYSHCDWHHPIVGVKYPIARNLYALVLLPTKPLLRKLVINMNGFDLVSWIIDTTLSSLFSQM